MLKTDLRRHNVRSLATMAVIAILSPAALAITASELQPLKTGDYWVYEVKSPFGSISEHRIEVTSAYGSWFQVQGYPFGDGYYKHYTSYGYQFLALWTGHTEGLIDANATLNASWPVATPDPCLQNATVTLIAENENVSTLAGDFAGGRRYTVAGNCADAGLTGLTLVPGIGLAQYTTSNIGGEVTYTLKRCSVGGAVYPKPAGVEVQVKTDKTAYANNEQVKATLTLINNSSDLISIAFNSTLEVDVTLAPVSDPTQIEYGYSHHLRLMYYPHKTDLMPGSPLVYELKFVPYAYSGSLKGEYVLRMFTSGDRRFAGEVLVKF